MQTISIIRNLRSFSTVNTVDNNEIKQFEKFASEWWNELGPMKPLHSLNKLRVPLIRDGLINTKKLQKTFVLPLKNLSILDVGCGGGILSERLARLGGIVTGLDASPNMIKQAMQHSKIEDLPNINYISSSIEDHADKNVNKYDAVVASEILEHVSQKEDFLKACVKCLKTDGSIFITTINQTLFANFMGIVLSEYVCNFLPKGTHQYEKFIEPHKLQRILEDLNCKTILKHGMFYNIFTNTWDWCSDDSINYALHIVKL